jgi:hypothetical protein
MQPGERGGRKQPIFLAKNLGSLNFKWSFFKTSEKNNIKGSKYNLARIKCI